MMVQTLEETLSFLSLAGLPHDEAKHLADAVRVSARIEPFGITSLELNTRNNSWSTEHVIHAAGPEFFNGFALVALT